MREALAAQRLDAETARVIVDQYREICASVPARMHDDMLLCMVDLAATEGWSPRELRSFRKRLIADYGRAGLLDKSQNFLARKRSMTAFTEDDDGMFCARISLDPASHAYVAAALDALSAPKTGLDARGDVVRDERSAPQRRADAFVELCANFPGLAGQGMRNVAKSKVVVTVGYADLVAGTGCGATATGEQLSPAAVRELACDAGVIPMVLGSSSEEIDLGREERLATPAQVTALRHRDGGCTYPGCSRPPTWCKAHHIRHWALGGRTDLTNLALLCQHHHSHVHRHDLTATVDEDGVRWHLIPEARGRHAD